MLIVSLLIAVMFSCNNGVAPLSESERAEVLSATMTAFSTASIDVPTPETSISSPARDQISYTGEGFTISGTDVPMKITITFTNYESMSVIINGSVTMSGSSAGDFETVASFTVIYNGEAHTLGWDFSYSSGVFSGSYTIDGSTYTYTYTYSY